MPLLNDQPSTLRKRLLSSVCPDSLGKFNVGIKAYINFWADTPWSSRACQAKIPHHLLRFHAEPTGSALEFDTFHRRVLFGRGSPDPDAPWPFERSVFQLR